MNKQRWAQLSGFEPESPLLMLEGNTPVYKEDLAQMIREEIQKVLAETQSKKDISNIENARKNKSLTTSMGFAGVGFASNNKTSSSAVSRGPGGTLGFGGPGFM
tara:strand:- start:229 stop:540 length:312 start_codon:yes stop_codon:yes gene_type:complete